MIKPLLRFFFSIVTYFILSFSTYAQADLDISALARTSQWLSLLHVQDKDAGEHLVSYVDDAKFFLAKGSFDAEAELRATITLLQQQPALQCKFPARTSWLKTNLAGFSQTLSLARCDEYQAWRKQLNTEKVVLSFAAAQLNSPSSMYGHTFFRFDPFEMKDNSTYLSYALNFGANTGDEDGGFLYALKGLTGGYPGTFAGNQYFQKIKEYNRVENRDLWEYQLNLTPNEVDFMLQHIWELQHINFDYYFFDENCSFRLLELLDVARPDQDILDHFPAVAIPLDTIRVVANAGFIDDVYYRPSILAELNNQTNQLSTIERELVYQLSQDASILQSEKLLTLPLARQTLVIDTAYRYLRYSNTFTQRNKTIAKRSFTLLKALNKQEEPLSINAIETPARPDSGHKTSMVSISAGQSNHDNYLDIQYRGSYHDLLDPQSGYYSDMSLNMVKVVARAYQEGGIQLQEAQLLDITSLSHRNEFIKPWSWKANISAEQRYTDQDESLVTQGTAGGGVSYSLFNHATFYSLAIARLEFNYKFEHKVSIAPGINVGLLYHWPKGVSLIDVEYYQLLGEVYRTRIKAEQSYTLSTNQSLRFSYRFNQVEAMQVNEAQIEYRYYF